MPVYTKRLIILANSIQPFGRCIAGIDIQTANWIRPVMEDRHSIPEEINIQRIKLLDVYDISFSGKPNPPVEFQIENEIVQDLNWKKIGSVNANQIGKYVNTGKQIFYSDTDCVLDSVLQSRQPNTWNSLQLIKVDVMFTKDSYKQRQWRANFVDGNGNFLRLKVTDLLATDILNAGKSLNGKCLLTLSLGRPWRPANSTTTKNCYKLVAGVIKI